MKRREDRTLSVDEIVMNSKKTMDFFRKNREKNEQVYGEERKKQTRGWGKLRKKFFDAPLQPAGSPVGGTVSGVTTGVVRAAGLAGSGKVAGDSVAKQSISFAGGA